MRFTKVILIILTVLVMSYCLSVAALASPDFARSAAVYLQDNFGNQLPPSSEGGLGYASYANDGNTGTFARAANAWAWTLHIDLHTLHYGISNVAITFANETLIPSDYIIMLSTDGENWRTVTEISDNTLYERRVHCFTPSDARYIRVRDMKEHPNISQMAVAEIEIYGQTSILGATLVSPTLDSNEIDVNSEIKILFDKEITPAYLSKITLRDSSGWVDSNVSLGEFNNCIEITPVNGLDRGERYTLSISGFNSWSFVTAGENLTKSASAKMLYLTEDEIPNKASEAAKAIDGDLNTYVFWTSGRAWSWIYELDFQQRYKNISRVYINFLGTAIPAAFKIQTSDDRLTWKTAASPYSMSQPIQVVDFSPTTARYLRIVSLERQMGICEVDVLSRSDFSSPDIKVLANGKANDDIILECSEEIDGDTVNNQTVQLESNRNLVPCTYLLEDNGRRVRVKPNKGLDYNTYYQITLSNGITDKSHNKFCGDTFGFVTEPTVQLNILSESDSEYASNREFAIYPAFVDNMPYQSWTEEKSTDYFQLRADGGKRPYTYSIVQGSLPAGLQLSGDGKIFGVPTAQETGNFTLRVTDSLGNTAEKELSLTAHPYRAKWFEDARFGAMIQWGAFANPSIKTPSDIAAFEERINDTWNADEWAEQMADMGIRVLNMTLLPGDGVRLWPSRASSVYEEKTVRNMADELIKACHNRNIKIVAYVASDYGWIKDYYESDLATMSTAQFTVNMVRELLELGVDGLWFDAGWMEGINRFDKLVPLIRTLNPYATIESNPSISGGGWIPQYPNVDMQFFECTELDDTDNALRIGFVSGVRKKMVADVSGLLGPVWADRGEPGAMTQLKSVSAIIKNIQDNWDNGATYLLCWPVMSDGTLVDPVNIAPSLYAVTDWVKANINPAEKPEASVTDEIEYAQPQTVALSSEEGADIYYTIDGTTPSNSSVLYTTPIIISESTRLKAVAYASGKGKSRIMEKDYIIVDPQETYISMLDEDSLSNIPQNKELVRNSQSIMTGMLVTVGANPVVLESIGRYATGDDGGLHHLIITEQDIDRKPLVSTDIDMSKSEADVMGFKYKRIAPVVLEAFKTYCILSEEDSNATYLNTDVQNFHCNYLRVEAGISTDSSWTNYLTSAEGNKRQQLLNLKFKVLPKVQSKNIALGAHAVLYDNNWNICSPSKYTSFSQNAVDGDANTYAMASGAWAWTLYLDLGSVQVQINRIKVINAEGHYPTKYEICASTDGVKWTKIAGTNQYTTNHASVLDHYIAPIDARYFYIRSTRPNDDNQEGIQMSVAEFEIYKKEN